MSVSVEVVVVVVEFVVFVDVVVVVLDAIQDVPVEAKPVGQVSTQELVSNSFGVVQAVQFVGDELQLEQGAVQATQIPAPVA